MSCTQSNPCTCITKCCDGVVNSPCNPKPGKGADDCCLFLCNGVVASQDAVGPCSQTGTLDLISLTHNFDCCVDAPVISVVDYDKSLFSSASVSGTVLTWTTVSGAPISTYGEVNLKTCCKTEDGTVLTHFSCQQIGIKDMCQCPDCPDKCEECDPCTGDCVEKAGEIKVSKTLGGKISVK